MKTMRSFFLILAVLFISMNISAQSGKSSTETFKVSGNCDMCKNRIEKAVKAEGATSASWDAKTKMLTVSFDPSKTSKDALAKKVASVGHDTEKYKADAKTYDALPGCCKYDRSAGNATGTGHMHN